LNVGSRLFTIKTVNEEHFAMQHSV